MSATLHDIVNGLTAATGYAEMFMESQPEHAEATRKFLQELERLKKQFISAVRGPKP